MVQVFRDITGLFQGDWMFLFLLVCKKWRRKHICSGSVEEATLWCRMNAGDSASLFGWWAVGDAGGQAQAYLPKQPELHHTSRLKNRYDSTTPCRENERVTTWTEERGERQSYIRRCKEISSTKTQRILWAVCNGSCIYLYLIWAVLEATRVFFLEVSGVLLSLKQQN